ncbi:MAG: GNAT family N-acetyltransferase [Patescibacteria group bacterium]
MDIKIKKYKPENTPSKELISLLREKYGKQENFDYFLNDFETAFKFCVENKNIYFEPIAIYFGSEMKAHIAIIKDYRLESDETFFGFFESPNDPAIFDLLWNELIISAKKMGVSTIKGPINGSIWHQYRVIEKSDASDFFKSEMICEPYYYNLLKNKNTKTEISYYSAYREKFDAILKAGQPAYEKLIGSGFSVQEFEKVNMNDLKEVIALSRNVFSKSWGFTDLTEEEFFQFYSREKLESHLNKLYLLYKGSEIIGFSSVLKENNSTLIFKTICLLPEYFGLGLGNVLAFKVHFDAERTGIKKIIYALVREDNNIKNFPKDDAVIFRKYAAFEFKI